MGCSCSQDADDSHRPSGGVGVHDAAHDDLTAGRRRRRHRNLSAHQDQQQAVIRHRGFQGGASDDDHGADDDDNDSARRRRRQQAQEEADFALAQVLFQEQLQFIDRQRRLEQQREAQPPASPTLPGLRADQFDAVGRVMRFDVAVTKPTSEAAAGVPDGAAKAAALTPITPNSNGGNADGDVFFATEPMECALCMEDLELGCELRLLFCGHAFHKTCVDDWLQRKRVCPMCQQDVTVVVVPPPAPPARHVVAAHAPGGWSSADRTSSDDDDDVEYVFEHVENNQDEAEEDNVDNSHGDETASSVPDEFGASQPPRGAAPLPAIPQRTSFESDRGSVAAPQSPIMAGAGACGASVSVEPPTAEEPPRSTTPTQIARPRCRSGGVAQRSAAVAVSMSDVVLTTASTTGALGRPTEASLPGHAASPQAAPAPAGAAGSGDQPQPECTTAAPASPNEDSSTTGSSLNPFNQAPEARGELSSEADDAVDE